MNILEIVGSLPKREFESRDVNGHAGIIIDVVEGIRLQNQTSKQRKMKTNQNTAKNKEEHWELLGKT